MILFNIGRNQNFSAPDGCLQYHTGIDGRFETFNFPGGSPVEQHLPSQDYRICVRQEEGMAFNNILTTL